VVRCIGELVCLQIKRRKLTLVSQLELNLRFELVKVYFDFNLHMPLDVVPPRVLPPPWRKPNEAGYVWYKVRHTLSACSVTYQLDQRRYGRRPSSVQRAEANVRADARLDGSDFPDFDFASGHAIALSELVRVQW
jgi:hypothetical protein